MNDWNIKIDGDPYVFGPQGGLGLGKAQVDAGAPMQVATITIPSFHHGPGQLVGRDPMQYHKATKVDTSRPGSILPAGGVVLQHNPSDVVFDDIHQSGFMAINDELFCITPDRIYKLDHAASTWASVWNNDASEWFTGSWARWRGKVIISREKDPAAPLGGDTSTRYAEVEPVVYDISGDSFSDAGAFGSGYYASHIESGKGFIWWIQNRGRFAAPRLYWSDSTEEDYGSFSASRLYGPFDLEQGGSCTALKAAGQHILIFKRDGSITGVDETKVWTSYTKDRGPIDDDFFGSSYVEFLSVLVFGSSQEGALVFNPGNLGLDSVEPSQVQSYVSKSDANFMGSATAFAVRGAELYALGKSTNGVILYTGKKYGQEGFFYSSDYGIYAIPDTALPDTDDALALRVSTGGGALRDSSNPRPLRATTTTTTFVETPRAATAWRHPSTGQHHLYVLHEVDTNQKPKIYQIDIAEPEWSVGPTSVAAGNLVTSRLFAQEARGATVIPLQLRGFVNIDGGTFTAGLGVEEGGRVLLGSATATGPFAFPMTSDLAGMAGRYFTVEFNTPADTDFRLETPVHLDVMYALRGDDTNDAIVVNVTVGDVVTEGALPAQAEENALTTAIKLLGKQHEIINLEFPLGITWRVYVEDVSGQQVEPVRAAQVARGIYVMSLKCRRLP